MMAERICSNCHKRFDESHEFKTCNACRSRKHQYRDSHPDRCPVCGEQRDDDMQYKTCIKCREYNLARHFKNHEVSKGRLKKRRKTLGDAGCCIDCGKPRESKKKRCAECRSKRNPAECERHNVLVIKWRELGLCTSCGGVRDALEYTTCETCRRKSVKFNKKWNAEHPERRRQINYTYIINNLEKVRTAKRRWGRENPEKCRANCHNRRARIKGNGGKLIYNAESILFEQQDGLCYLCGKLLFLRFDDPISIEHKIPVSRGGANDISNVGLAHLSCNKKKFTKTDKEYLEELKNEKQSIS